MAGRLERPWRLRATLACLALAVPGLAGCDDDEREEGRADGADSRAVAEVRRTVRHFYDALARRDGGAACELLTASLRARFDTTAAPCAGEVLRAAIGPEPPRDPGLGASSIRGSTATAVVSRAEGHGAAERVLRERISLRRARGRWRIADVEPVA